MVSSHCRRVQAFTLIELLVVLAIISILSAMLFPVFATVRGKARQMACLSNLRQIGQGVAMYMQDYDNFFPHGVDPADKAEPTGFAQYPEFASAIPHLKFLHEILQPYLKSKEMFRCPADTGLDYDDFTHAFLNARPSGFERFGTSYYYRTELVARSLNESSLSYPTEINVLFDSVGYWHGTLTPIASRYNVLFADGHAKNITRTQIDYAWSLPLTAQG